MSVLICKNIDTEGPGTIETFLKSNGIRYSIVGLSKGEEVTDPDSYDTLVMLGGPMSVNDSGLFPYLSREEILARDFIAKGKRVLGICLGAQIMAKALGAKVYRGPAKEIGWHDIELSEEGISDRLMLKLAAHPQVGDVWKKFKVFHWHGETFDIPEGALRLAGSQLYRNQAFRYGSSAYAFQFHIEVGKDMIYDWLKEENVDLESIRAETENIHDIYLGRANNFYAAFFKN